LKEWGESTSCRYEGEWPVSVFAPIFLSHGAPTLAIEDVPARHFLEELGASMPHPRAILVVSAHWETRVPFVNAVAVNDTIHDFRGFPRELHEMRYPAPGSPLVAGEVADLLDNAGFATKVHEDRGLDHGAWVPLILMYPEAQIPVVQLSVQTELGPEHHLNLGRALEPLTRDGVLIVGSGSFTHDLSSIWNATEEPEWVKSFADWMDEAIVENRVGDLIHYRNLAPNAERNHPTEEHLLPLFVALGAAGDSPLAKRIHSSVSHGVLRMDAYRFHTADEA
jgi:4,5-DOPA dioxygenase extradiol